MKLFNSKENVAVEQKAGGGYRLPFRYFLQHKVQCIFIAIFILSLIFLMISCISKAKDKKELKEQQHILQEEMQSATEVAEGKQNEAVSGSVTDKNLMDGAGDGMLPEYEMLSKYVRLYQMNPDFAGWLRIEDTVIDYPVMQCLEDENYYLTRDFFEQENDNGSLLLDNDSHVGVGMKEQEYEGGSKPSTNLIIHGHTKKTGLMFGELDLYQDKEYGLAHNIICFDSLYEKREYELIACFYSQVYYVTDDVFKYYKFFQADTEEEFDDWYNNIKKLSLYDTGVTAEFGDEFITLSCCAYHVKDGRFVVVGRRIKE